MSTTFSEKVAPDRPSWMVAGMAEITREQPLAYTLSETGRVVAGHGPLNIGDVVTAHIEQNEVKFRCDKVAGGEEVAINALGLSEKDQMNLMGQLLNRYAKRGYDPDKSKTNAAACHVISDYTHLDGWGHPIQRVFIASNQNHRPRSQRPDAEVRALDFAKEQIKNELDANKAAELKIEETYLTLRHTKSKAGDIFTPCGTCREDLTDSTFVSEDASLYCLPYQEPGTEALLDVDDQSLETYPNPLETPLGFALKQRMMSLVPHRDVEFDQPVGNKDACEVAYEAMQLMQDGKPAAGYLPIDKKELATHNAQGRSSELPYLSGEGYRLDYINSYLSNRIKSACNDYFARGYTLDDLAKVRVSVMVLEDGRCFSSMYMDGEGLANKPLGEIASLSNAYNPTNLKEVFTMELDPEHIANQYARFAAGEQEVCTVRNVYPEALERIYKSAKVPPEKWGEESHRDVTGKQIEDRCVLHSLPLNAGDLSCEALERAMKSFGLREVMPGPYVAPNSMVAVQNEHDGCCR